MRQKYNNFETSSKRNIKQKEILEDDNLEVCAWGYNEIDKFFFEVKEKCY